MVCQSINDIVNGSSFKNYNANDNVSSNTGFSRIERADRLASNVCRKMGNTGDEVAYRLYCKAAYNLSENQIWSAVELAQERGRDPIRYLSWLLSRELRRSSRG